MCRGAVLIALYVPSCLDKARSIAKRVSINLVRMLEMLCRQIDCNLDRYSGRPGDDDDDDRGCVQESNRNWVITHKLRFVL